MRVSATLNMYGRVNVLSIGFSQHDAKIALYVEPDSDGNAKLFAQSGDHTLPNGFEMDGNGWVDVEVSQLASHQEGYTLAMRVGQRSVTKEIRSPEDFFNINLYSGMGNGEFGTASTYIKDITILTFIDNDATCNQNHFECRCSEGFTPITDNTTDSEVGKITLKTCKPNENTQVEKKEVFTSFDINIPMVMECDEELLDKESDKYQKTVGDLEEMLLPAMKEAEEPSSSLVGYEIEVGCTSNRKRAVGYAFCFMRAHYSKPAEPTTEDENIAHNPFDFSRTREQIEENVKEAIEKSDETYVQKGQTLDILTNISSKKPDTKGESVTVKNLV